MSYSVAAGDPFWTLDPQEFEKQVAIFAKNGAITSQTNWLAFIATLDATQTTQAVRALLRSVKCNVP